ncbi:secreted RxLR effector protein 161-like [Xenia sp. Carnegie-2017]|uniref:secreted RxLR effector protein 161-like n=1 Tax=Xenia sp. Carnegie-2017 TaxID=2897299 RepID=UPI001F044CF0|nr:secreted RxLR effector protein 161-like [Xenia sp. Carnegie-2017]
MAKPSKEHWSGVKRILRYLKGTTDHGLKFSAEGNPDLLGFSDADWAGDINTGKSTSGYIFQIGNCTVSWSSRKQRTVAKRTTEEEYVALSYTTQEAIWIQRLLMDITFGMEGPITIFEDNQGAIELAKNAKYHNRTNIDICHHFVRERVQSKEVNFVHCSTDQRKADILTKGLPKFNFEKLRSLIGVTTT